MNQSILASTHYGLKYPENWTSSTQEKWQILHYLEGYTRESYALEWVSAVSPVNQNFFRHLQWLLELWHTGLCRKPIFSHYGSDTLKRFSGTSQQLEQIPRSSAAARAADDRRRDKRQASAFNSPFSSHSAYLTHGLEKLLNQGDVFREELRHAALKKKRGKKNQHRKANRNKRAIILNYLKAKHN